MRAPEADPDGPGVSRGANRANPATTSMASSPIAFSAALALLLLASPALAAPTAAQRETARRLMDEGKERMRSGEKERAIEAYKKAHDLMHVPSTGMALARAHLAAGHLVEARDVALEVVRMPREEKEPAVFEQSRKAAKELEASLKGRIPTVRILVKGAAALKVTADDAEIAPLLVGEPIALDPGHHVIVAKNADGIEKRAEIDLAERDIKEVELVLPAARPQVVTAPVDNPHKTTARAPTEAPSSERTTTANVLVFGGFGLAVAGAVAGGITGALTLSKASDVKSQCENGICDPAAAGDLDTSRGLATISTIGFAVAGAGVVLGVVGLLLPRTDSTSERERARSASSQTALHFTPRGLWVGPGSAGVGGTF